MIRMETLTYARMLRSLRSMTCPCCGGVKKMNQSLCFRDYRTLPRPMRNALYNLMGDGYAEAMLEALNYLNSGAFHMPDGTLATDNNSGAKTGADHA